MSYKLGEVFVELPMISRSRCVPDKFVSNEELCIYINTRSLLGSVVHR